MGTIPPLAPHTKLVPSRRYAKPQRPSGEYRPSWAQNMELGFFSGGAAYGATPSLPAASSASAV